MKYLQVLRQKVLVCSVSALRKIQTTYCSNSISTGWWFSSSGVNAVRKNTITEFDEGPSTPVCATKDVNEEEIRRRKTFEAFRSPFV